MQEGTEVAGRAWNRIHRQTDQGAEADGAGALNVDPTERQECWKIFQHQRGMGLSARVKDMTDEEMIELLSTDGMLVKRPLFIMDGDVLVGFKEAEWAEKLL